MVDVTSSDGSINVSIPVQYLISKFHELYPDNYVTSDEELASEFEVTLEYLLSSDSFISFLVDSFMDYTGSIY